MESQVPISETVTLQGMNIRIIHFLNAVIEKVISDFLFSAETPYR